MFCPECRSEYVAGVAVCGDCGSPLVAELPAAAVPEFVAYEPILSTQNPAEIALIRSILEDAGIDCRFFADVAGPPLGLPARLLVPKERAGEAREILGGFIEAGQAAGGGEGDEEGG